MLMDDVMAKINTALSEAVKKGFHVPGVTVITEYPEFMKPSLRIVTIDTIIPDGEKSNDDIYPVGGGKYAFGRAAIAKFRDAGSIELKILRTFAEGMRFTAHVSGQRFDLDGSPKRTEDVKVYDLVAREEELRLKYTESAEKYKSRDTDEQKMAYVNKCVREAMRVKHKYATEMAITGAQARVVTKLLGLKPAYTLAELKQPFFIVAMTPVVDMRDPAIKGMVTAHMLGIRDTLYPVRTEQLYRATDTAIDVPAVPAATHTSDHEAVVEASGQQPLLSVEDFDDCPRSTKVSILRRLVSDEGVKDRLGQLEEEALTMLYEQRRAA